MLHKKAQEMLQVNMQGYIKNYSWNTSKINFIPLQESLIGSLTPKQDAAGLPHILFRVSDE